MITDILLSMTVLAVMGGFALILSAIQKNNTPELIEERYQEYMLSLKEKKNENA